MCAASPCALTNFIGRAQAVRRNRGQLERNFALVTVTEPSSARKTQLLLAEVCQGRGNRFADAG